MSWLGRKRSPRLATGAVATGTASGGVDMVSSGSVERPADGRTGSAVVGSWLEGAGQGLHNPLAWDSIPSSLKEKFPHWKEESSPSSKANSEVSGQDYSCYKSGYNTKQQPDYTFPYVVMDNDTLSSIAVKFETTPAELARLNKKPLGVNSTIFTGEVLYVPDQEEMARSAPKPAPLSKVMAAQEQLQGSIDSQGTLRSSSLSQPLEPIESVTDPALQGTGVAAPSSEGKIDHSKGASEEESREEQMIENQPSPKEEFFEEIADDHIVLVSKYISDDQGCAHGHLMINRTALMFTPFLMDPLVQEHGSANFEVMIPLQDIIFAAFARDVNPPSNKKKTVTEIPLVINEESLRENEEGSNGSVVKEDGEGVGVEKEEGMAGGKGEEGEAKEEEEGVEKERGEGVAGEEGEAKEEEEGVAKEGGEGMADGKGEEGEAKEEKECVEKERGEGVADGKGEEGEAKEEESVVRKEGEVGVAEGQGVDASREDKAKDENKDAAKDEGEDSKVDMVFENGTDQVPQEDAVVTEKRKEEFSLRQGGSGEYSGLDEGEVPAGETRKGHPNQPSCSSTDELLAIMGMDTVAQLPRPTRDSQTVSESSGDNHLLLSEQPCFLHLRVSHKCSAAHTYTPVNLPVGIDIPQNKAFHTPRGLLQQVRLNFCFAVAEGRVGDLVSFIARHHPGGAPCEVRSPVPSSWSDGSFEFIAYEDGTQEDLTFSDNHFKGAESSESWEICSLKDFSKYRRIIDKMEVEHELPLPLLSEESVLMKESHLKALSPNLVSSAVGHDWVLIYSTFKHGISLRTLYRNMQLCELEETAVVLLVRDDQNKLFGATVTARLRISEKFYGTGESFLFSFESPSDLEIYPWTGANSYIIKGNSDSIGIGCDDGHYGLWLDEYLLNGCSQECSTFANACLSSATEFTCTGLEAWGFR